MGECRPAETSKMPRDVSWDELPGLPRATSIACHPQGSFTDCPEAWTPVTARKSWRRALGLGTGAGKGSVSARQIKTDGQTEGRGTRTEALVRSHSVSSHPHTLRCSRAFEYAHPGLYTHLLSYPWVCIHTPATAEPWALPTGSLLVTPFHQPGTPPPETWSWE